MEISLAGIAALGCIVLAIWAIFVRPFFSPFRHLPRARQENVILRLFAEPSTFEIEAWMREQPNEGLIRYYGFLNQERILLTTPEVLKHVLLRDAGSYGKLPSIGAVQVPAGVSGLVSAEGELHKMHRRHTIGAFTSSNIRPLVPIIWSAVQKVADRLGNEVIRSRGSAVWMNDLLRLACVDISGAAGLGLWLPDDEGPERTRTRAYLKPFVVGDMVPLFLKLLQLSPERLQSFFVKLTSSVLWNLDINDMRDLVQRRLEGAIRDVEYQAQSKDVQNPYLVDQIATRAVGRISARSLLRHVMTTLAACTEMVSNELSWAIYALSHPKNVHVQDRLREEILSRHPLRPTSLDWKDFADMPYLIGVVNEVLRLYPNVAHRYRVCRKATTLHGLAVPKETVLTWPVWAMNRDPTFWGADAADFRPERWFEDGDREQYAFMTFGQGIRKCPGEHYTRTVMACMLFGLVGGFRFEMPEGADVLADGGTSVAFGIVMRAKILANVEEVPGW